jgi:alcohol dehydrogenase class IV
MDALTQCIEPYISHLSTPITDPLCLKGIELSSRSLIKTFQNGNDLEARGEMALASLFGGLALANAKLGAVHGFAGPIGGMFSAPHGAVCAALLLPVVEINLRVLGEREPGNVALQRYAKVGEIVSGKQNDGHQGLLEWLSRLCQALDIPGLAEYGIKKESFTEIIENSIVSSSMKGNPVQLDKDHLFEVLERAL